jgi:hypothetical protein
MLPTLRRQTTRLRLKLIISRVIVLLAETCCACSEETCNSLSEICAPGKNLDGHNACLLSALFGEQQLLVA